MKHQEMIMEHFPPIRSVALCAILSAQLVLSPIFAASAYAAGVTPDPNAPGNKRPSMDVSANGVPLVNITAPNSSGLSHNQYSDFNVRQQGLILNNSSQAVNTQIGGIIAGNPNFYGNSSNEARTILNEVTSANRSRIEGYIEVGGRAADVILANPNGITVNGGGFINVPRATLSTGVPQVNPSGALTGHEVKRGDISIEGAGINADNTDAFTLLARTAYVEAQVRGKNVTVVAGRNNIATDGTVTPLADDPANPKPQVAIDSSALGGMYANRISLIATEKGVGVNLEGTVQSADQMVITADGKLRLREASSGGNAVLASNGDVEVVGGSVTAGKDLTVAADNLRVKKGSLEPQYETRKAARQGVTPPPPAPAATPTSSLLYAGNDMALATANELLNEQSEIRAAHKLTISSADGRGTNRVRNSSGTLAAGTDLSITAKSLENFRTILNIQRDTGYYQESRWVNEIKGDGDEVWKDAHTIDKSLDVLAPSTEAGIISADNDIMLVLEAFSNSTGHIAAGRNLSLLATTSAVNASAALYRNTYTKIEYEHWDEDDDYVGRDHRFVYYTDREVVRPFSASITAGDTLTITGATLQNTTDRSNTSPLTTRDTAEVAGAVTALSESAMFHPVTTPGHHYLIETNSALTNLGNFYGSDYFLSRIGLDQKKQQVVLLGDAYYETRLVQQQILQSTGQRFLHGYSSDADQMRGLMDAAVAQGKALNLAAGVELTSAQVAALTQDIVWLVEQEVDGQKVYVPRVYLAANSPNSILTGGSLVAANTVNITADSVTNSGSTIRGANNLTMLAGNITNEEGGTLSGKTVQLAAVQDIRNQGAYIAGETLSLTAGRDIISAAKVELAEGSSAKASQSRVARASGI
ncbi:MAG: filamentous hemagglutinin N-terminal domain-containing protein, partial [Deltaproteobacteria bacterium]|nr:filamentous hemagglutinin N-terminal domain-containing protein [Deltaproteobacteria bacterium]